jgi:sugar phosphate isomerase/epimerase
MQGRLLPKFQGRFQAHPIGYWHDEFQLAANLGFDCIEFILDFDQVLENPLLVESGLTQIQKLTADTGVRVLSVCADYFMVAPLHSVETDIAHSSLKVLNKLMYACATLEVTDLVIPCVDISSIRSKDDQDRLVNVLETICGPAKDLKINLALETDLGPYEFKEFLNRIPVSSVTVNYDIGNSASLGFDSGEEISAYGQRISDVHIKDRVRGGGSVPLGTGDSKIIETFSMLQEINYCGPLILQAYRGVSGLPETEQQLNYIKDLLLLL